jgi:hypothetical protein
MVGEIVVTKNVFRIMSALLSAKSNYAIHSLSIVAVVFTLEQ